MAIRADLSGVQAGGGSSIPAGTYLCSITGAEETESKSGKNPGTPMVKWEFTVEPGDEYHGRKLFLNTLLVQNESFGGLSRIKEILLATGKWTKEEVDDDIAFSGSGESVDEDLVEQDKSVIGCLIRVTCKVKPATAQYDEGNNVTKIRPADTEDESLLP